MAEATALAKEKMGEGRMHGDDRGFGSSMGCNDTVICCTWWEIGDQLHVVTTGTGHNSPTLAAGRDTGLE